MDAITEAYEKMRLSEDEAKERKLTALRKKKSRMQDLLKTPGGDQGTLPPKIKQINKEISALK